MEMQHVTSVTSLKHSAKMAKRVLLLVERGKSNADCVHSLKHILPFMQIEIVSPLQTCCEFSAYGKQMRRRK